MQASEALFNVLGWKATVLHGDPCVYSRWVWLRTHLTPGNRRTLDAGSGSGAFSMYASLLGNDTVGISFDAANNEKARRRAERLGLQNIRFLTADLCAISEHQDGLGLFDQILCLETIEHIEDDQQLVNRLAAMLRPGGKLLLTAPYKHYRPLLFDKVSETQDGGHVRWGYTHENLGKLMVNAGLEVSLEEYVSGFVDQQLTNAMRLLAKTSLIGAWLLTAPFRWLRIFDAAITRVLNYPYLCVAVVARKPTE